MTDRILIIGSSNTDMTVKIGKLPSPGETVLGGTFTMGDGGKGANQAVAAKRLGGKVSFMCKVGKDIFGDNALRHYRDEGLDMSSVLRGDKASGVALICVDSNAENCIAVASGANTELSVDDIEDARAMIEDSSILLMQLEIPVESVMRAAEIAHNAGVQVVLNPAPACPLPDEIFKYISLFIPNEVELSQYAGIPVRDCNDAARAAGILKDKGVKGLVVTLGSKGSLICDGTEPTLVPARKVSAVDTTGAGDTFCGALCVALSEGKDLHRAVEFATAASAIAVTRIGAQGSAPSRQEVDEIL